MAAPFMYAFYDKDDEPASPHAVLISHVVLKGFQARVVLGLVLSPVYLALRKKELLMKTRKSSIYVSCGFAEVSSAMLAQEYRSFGPTRNTWMMQ